MLTISRVSKPGELTAMPSAMVLTPPTCCVPLTTFTIAEAIHLHADDLDRRPARAGRHRHARDQPAAADGDHQRVEVRHRVQHFQRDGAHDRR